MTPTTSTTAPLRILVAEDSATEAMFVRQRLIRMGFDVRIARNGLEALAEIDRDPPTLVLTDLEMPEMDGLELVRKLSGRQRKLPVIVMTARGSEEHAVEAMRGRRQLRRQGADESRPLAHH